jgi:FkbM family methyltransferase
MVVRDIVRNTAENILYSLVPNTIIRHIPQGVDLFYDLRKLKKDYSPAVMFDVGANVGQTVMKWKKFFTKTTYHCFEPVAETMATLKKNTRGYTNVLFHQCALGETRCPSEIKLFRDSRFNSLNEASSASHLVIGKETVEVDTIDHICLDHNIRQIDFLKIDAEGFDLEVLRGATSMLNARQITFIQVEAGMNPFNKRHIAIHQFMDFLQPFGYILFGIYGQHLEWSGAKRLRMCNPVFISDAAGF